MYWELLDVDSQGVLSLGATYNRGAGSGGYQVADAFYYASGGYYVTLDALPNVARHRGRKTIHARVAWRFRFRGATGDAAWRREARFRIGDDEKHYQSRDFISSRYIICAVVASPMKSFPLRVLSSGFFLLVLLGAHSFAGDGKAVLDQETSTTATESTEAPSQFRFSAEYNVEGTVHRRLGCRARPA